jgi:glycerophosphoryl diester phosphodiesterase
VVKFPIPRAPIVAHRGASFDYPENTLAAFRGALAAGADGCELDVYKTADDRLIIFHDTALNRMTNVKAPRDDKGKEQKVRQKDLTLAEIKKLKFTTQTGRYARPWKAKDFADERIPTLDEALALLKPAAPKTIPVVEIKVEEIEAPILAALRARDLYDKSVIIAFSETVVKQVRKLAPDYPVAWLHSASKFKGTPAELADFYAQKGRELDTPLLDLDHRYLTKEIIATLHQRGFTVWAWTVDDPARMKELLDWGIDSITTNKPALLKQVTGAQR